ncbi:MAG: hypothetical protein H3C60_10435 [Sphingomonadaceae bacterium]|nr:hypothetical protein [Sphingomonadaceae bacterium]
MLGWFWTRLSEAGPEATISGRALLRLPTREVQRLLRARVLVERRKVDHWPVCPHCDCGLVARPVQEIEDRLLACCPCDAAEDVILTPEDLRRFTMEPHALASAIAATGGLGPVEAVGGDLWRLGSLPVGFTIFLVLHDSVLQQPGVVAVIRAAAAGAVAAVIVPAIGTMERVRLQEAGLHILRLADVLIADADGIERLDLRDLKVAPDGPELTFRTGSGLLEWRGRSIVLSHQLTPVFLRLLEKVQTRNPVLSHHELEGTSGREARDLVRELRAKVVQAGFTAAEAKVLVVMVRGHGYQLGVAREKIAVLD